MIESYSISVYPHKEKDIWSYIIKAKQYGCKELFTSAHLPEKGLREQLDFVQELSEFAHGEGLRLTVDFGGGGLREIFRTEALSRSLKQAELDWIRLDYGYGPSFLGECFQKLGIRGFALNASILKEEEAEGFLREAEKYGSIRLQACHNFYPRPETGLDACFMKEQYDLFHRHGISVMACIASQSHPRLPLHKGLPTMEEQRFFPVERAALELERQGLADAVLVGDEFLQEEELTALWKIVGKDALSLRCKLSSKITQIERTKLLGEVHRIRYDSNSSVLRSQTSREMSEFACRIPPHTTEERKALSITIDNERYLRYSGEVQFVQKALPADERVNVVGQLVPEDAWKLAYYRQGYSYRLIEI